MQSKTANRIVWIDQWRGVAVFLMIIYHLAFDLDYQGLYPIDQGTLFWFFEGNFVRLSFLLVVGISLFLSYQNHSSQNKSFALYFKRHLKRALIVLAFAMLITLVTWLFARENTIIFGILHLIAFGIVFGALVVRNAFLPILLGLISFYLGAAFSGVQSSIHYLLPLGIKYPGFTTFDYFPLFPWVGFVFFGIALAHFLSRAGALKQPLNWPRLKPLSFLGHHALLIYLIHQPILLGGLWLLTL